MKNTPYDIIGDIHGHADELHALLAALGYRKKDGVYRHSEGRTVVFLGDFIDRGPKIRQVLETARAMTEAGTAHAIMGNHEINALRYHAKGKNGEPLRPHTEKNMHQHAATLKQLPGGDMTEWLEWFAGLPLWLDLGGIRAVHACWDDDAMEKLRNVGRMEGSVLEAYSRKDYPEYDIISQILNGPEGILPDGALNETADGTMRSEFRVKWWAKLEGLTSRDAIFPADSRIRPVPPKELPSTHPHPADAPPTFFGHYALKDPLPSPILPNLACLDYGTGKGGFLCAYRWDGEREIDRQKFCAVPDLSEICGEASGGSKSKTQPRHEP